MADEMGTFETVLLAWHTPEIGVMTLNRPEAGNSFSAGLRRDVAAVAREVRGRDGMKALVITGAGRLFCAGMDLKEQNRGSGAIWDLREALDLIEELPFPVIAAINGASMGGGTELALVCDFRVMARSAKLGLPEIKFGTLPAAGGPQRLLRTVGIPNAKWLVMSGESIDAAEAYRIGLVDEVAEDGEALHAALVRAEKLAERAAYALRAAKLAINRGASGSQADGLMFEYELITKMATPEESAAERRKAAERDATYGKIFGR
ncbi:MAG: enoyl-CoA hydratase/isomerase family protein [Tepidiformaceae bacterium]